MMCNTCRSSIVERDQCVSVSCARNHMWLTCFPLETKVFPWWAPQAQSTQKFPGNVIRLGQWVTDLALESTHTCATKGTNIDKDTSSTKTGRGKGSSTNQPELRITHRVCCENTLETLLSVMNRSINSSEQKETVVGRTGIVPSPQRTALFFKRS